MGGAWELRRQKRLYDCLAYYDGGAPVTAPERLSPGPPQRTKFLGLSKFIASPVRPVSASNPNSQFD